MSERLPALRAVDPESTPEYRWAILYRPAPGCRPLGELALIEAGWDVLGYYVTRPPGPAAAAAFLIFELFGAADELELPVDQIGVLRAIAAARGAA